MNIKLKHITGSIIIMSMVFCQSFAQTISKPLPKDWQLLDYKMDSVYGTSVERAYLDLLRGKKSHPVIVAVIDSGIDTSQQDLQGRIWVNPGEIPNNGIDDDHNGYVDDIHGWNFLGGKNGTSLVRASSEAQREYYRLKKIYGNASDSMAMTNKKEYAYWLVLKDKAAKDSANNAMEINRLPYIITILTKIDSVLQKATHKDKVNFSDIDTLQTTDIATKQAKNVALQLYKEVPHEQSFNKIISEGKQELAEAETARDEQNEDPNASRRKIVGDNPFDINDRDYGNNNINYDTSDPASIHGTHVAGIIAAIRNNHIGMDGICDNVIIMPIKAVPDGDERDKDIALAIRYAVNNGAKIINMSFGKPYSPQKAWVDDAVKYAAAHDVLLVHAAGNSSADNDSIGDYPSPEYLDSTGMAPNFIEVGASSSGQDSGEFVASFSNYGKKDVDLFAPGEDIYSTVPHNSYESLSGTSMAAPMVSGIAALLLEYYPRLSAVQLHQILDQSVLYVGDSLVDKPGTDQKVKFSTLCRTGGIVNAYNALKLAATIRGKRKKERKKRRHRF
ncbi:MAG TPA: S8 family peptidase [Chitinophagaceae bacterium]|nr:S8 family peptidase [Chitinophagaceae bacterium]